jgi:hypothetical protein
MPTNFNALMDPAQVGQQVQAGFNAGRDAREQQTMREVMVRLAQNPDDEEAARLLVQVDPRAGMAVIQDQRERRERQQFTSAARDYVSAYGSGAQPNALMGPPQGINAFAPMGGQQAAGGMVEAMPGAVGVLDGQEGVVSAAPPPGATDGGYPISQPTNGQTMPSRGDLVASLGQPRSRQDAAFMQMFMQDPKRAFEIDSAMRDRLADRFDLQRKAWDFAGQQLGAAGDDATYQGALQAIQQQIEPLGVEVTDYLPATYPGPDGIRAIRMKAMEAKEQLDYLLDERDTAADNARADRNTDSLIDTRQERVEIYRGNTRSDNVRADRNTDSLIDNRNKPRARGGRGGQAIVDVATPAEARALAPGTRFRTPDGKIKIR